MLATRVVNLSVLAILLAIVLSMPFAVSSPRINKDDVCKSVSPKDYCSLLSTPRAVSDHKIRLAPNFSPLLENFLGTSLITPPCPVNPLNSWFLTRFLKSPPNPAIGAISPRQRAPHIHHNATARSQGVAITLPATLLPLLNPMTSRILNNPPPPSPFSTTPRRTSPGLTLVRRTSSLLPNQPIKLV